MDKMFSHINRYLFIVVFYRSYRYFKISTFLVYKINNIYNLILEKINYYLLLKIIKKIKISIKY